MNNSNFPFPKFRWTRFFITRVACVCFNPTRNFTETRRQYNIFVGRSFWRLVLWIYAKAITQQPSFTSGEDGFFEADDLDGPENEQLQERVVKALLNGDSEGAEKLFAEEVAEAGPDAISEPPSEFLHSPRNALITGIRGCGKSHLLMTTCAFLTPRTSKDSHRNVCIGDCRAWAQSENPTAFFSMELMMAFRMAPNEERRFSGNSSSSANGSSEKISKGIEEGNYTPPGIFSKFDDLKAWLEAVGKRVAVHDDLRLTVFVDQLEDLYGPVVAPGAAEAAKIFELLISLKFPIVVAAVIPNPVVLARLPPVLHDPSVFAQMKMPAILNYTEFDLFAEVFEASRKLTDDDDPVMHDLRMWTGGVAAQIAKFFTSTGTGNVAHRLVKYRTDRTKAFSELLFSALSKMDRLPKMHLLLQIIRMILHIPSDDPNLSPGAAINGLESLFLPAAIQRFYHPREGIVHYRHIPTAVSPAAHYALCEPKVLGRITAKWEQVMEAVLTSTLNSKNVCSESKRRIVHFFAQFRLFQLSFDQPLPVNSKATAPVPAVAEVPFCNADFLFSGVNQYNDKVEFVLPANQPVRRVIFAGLSPSPILIPSGRCGSFTNAPIVFIPGRTDFCFYDVLVAVPADRCLYAISTIPFKDNGTDTLITVNTLNNAPLTPFTLLDMWLKDLKDAGYTKFSAKPLFIEPFELLSQLKSSFKRVTE